GLRGFRGFRTPSGARCLDRRLLARGAVGHPRAVAARGVRGLPAHAGLVEPQRLRAFTPRIAAIDDDSRSVAAALRVDGRKHDVGTAAGLGQTAFVAHQGNPPWSLAPAAQAGVATETCSLLLGTCGPFLRALLAAAPRPGVGDEAIEAR